MLLHSWHPAKCEHVLQTRCQAAHDSNPTHHTAVQHCTSQCRRAQDSKATQRKNITTNTLNECHKNVKTPDKPSVDPKLVIFHGLNTGRFRGSECILLRGTSLQNVRGETRHFRRKHLTTMLWQVAAVLLRHETGGPGHQICVREIGWDSAWRRCLAWMAAKAHQCSADVAEEALRDAGAADGRNTVRCKAGCHAEPQGPTDKGGMRAGARSTTCERHCRETRDDTSQSRHSDSGEPAQLVGSQCTRCNIVSKIRCGSELLGAGPPRHSLLNIDPWQARLVSERS